MLFTFFKTFNVYESFNKKNYRVSLQLSKMSKVASNVDNLICFPSIVAINFLVKNFELKD